MFNNVIHTTGCIIKSSPFHNKANYSGAFPGLFGAFRAEYVRFSSYVNQFKLEASNPRGFSARARGRG